MEVARRFSVIMPAYNSRATIARAIQSALAQTLAPHEIIVVDDGSVDGTHTFVTEEFGPKVRIFQQQNAGPSKARNRAAREATGDWLAFLDSDDEWMPEKLARQSSFLDQHPDAALCATGYTAKQEDGREELFNLAQNMSRQTMFDELSRRTLFLLSSVAMRREVFLELGGFPEQLHCSEDRDLWARVAVLYPIATMDAALTRKHELSGSLSADPEKTLRDGLEANRRVIALLAREGGVHGAPSALRRANSLLYRSVAILHADRGNRRAALRALRTGVGQDPLATASEWKRRLGMLLRLAR